MFGQSGVHSHCTSAVKWPAHLHDSTVGLGAEVVVVLRVGKVTREKGARVVKAVRLDLDHQHLS